MAYVYFEMIYYDCAWIINVSANNFTPYQPTYILARKHAHTHAYTHTSACIYAHCARARTHTHTHTHKHTHTNTPNTKKPHK